MEHKNKRNVMWGGVVAVLVIVTVLVVVLSPSDGGGNSPGATVTPMPPWLQGETPEVTFVMPATIKRNTVFSTTVDISEVVSLWGARFDVQYDPSFFTFMNYSYGAVNGTPPDALVIYRMGEGENGEGLLRVLSKWSNYSATNNGFGVNGSGHICELVFRAGNKAGTTKFSFPEGKGNPPGERTVMQLWNGTVYGLEIGEFPVIKTTININPPDTAGPTATANTTATANATEQ